VPNCRGCGSVLDPTQEEVNQAVDQVLVASLNDAIKHGETCPLCGHSKAAPISHRKSVQFGLLLALLLLVSGLTLAYRMHRNTERLSAARDALDQLETNAQIRQLLGVPLRIEGKVIGDIKQDETGWHEVKLTVPVRGPKADGTIRISGGREKGPWIFTTLEVLVPQLHKRADLLTGRIIEYSPDAYADVHTEAVAVPEYVLANVSAPLWDGEFPCVYAVGSSGSAPQIGNCITPVPMSQASRTPVDRFETDLRRGKFILRQTDLSISEAGLQIPLTRTYTAQDWMPTNPVHAFGRNANHPFDIAPLGTRNPYSEQYIVLEDGDFLYFPRVSKGSGYADAIYRHSETATTFYKAIHQWDGNGWLTKLQDGSTIRFPESYSAKNLAQGAPTEMTDAMGNKIQLIRDPKRNLKEIRSPAGNSITFEYDDYDRVVRAQDSNGHSVKYTYNSAGFLTDVVNSSGAARYYFYEDGLLTWVRDENNRLLIHNEYKGDWLRQQSFGNGDVIRYRYDLSPNTKYAEQAIVTLPDGSVKTVQTSESVSDVYKRMR